MTDDTVLRVRGLRKRYRQVTAVDGVDLTVAAGERVALVGPNGAGKTTTLMSCLGAVQPEEGTVELLGQRGRRARRAVLARVGFASGYLPLPPHLRVREFLTLYARLYGAPNPQEQARAGLRQFDVEGLADRWGSDLSSGQRTVVGVVKATMHAPALLVLDEPTASLDPDVALRVRGGLLDLCRRRGTALLVTSHNMVEVERLAQRVIFLAGGRVLVDGPVETITAQLGQTSLEDVYLRLRESTADGRQASTGASS
ncbi:ABC transporter ATP-binding protein [Micromonospora yangpuensis]|uniref:ABC-2 type transport system ATP-binding protein n=1 Tax=Micromonospora yangpuensis TaxID=683228 RepID=A0A1C6UL85_9ACTN|nr:ABC transporter ATP-binding protein [Micromonospora yangpuensis]GGM17703.1 ABC transporter [Micromonospora yangpuensis]SCL54810.1 ABC-2 type transport system ATP-binding protein [Micromonospora yangpuensis]